MAVSAAPDTMFGAMSATYRTMATTSDIKNGLCLRHQGGLYQVLEFLHKKTARGSGNVWTKMKNLENLSLIHI